MTYRDLDGERPLLDAAEIDFLRIPRGSLSADERRKMEQHVTQSFYFLREIPWTKTPWAQRARVRLRPPRAPRRHRLPARPARADAIAPQVRHADDQRHLRRADRQRPALQAGDAGRARARHPRRASSPSAARSTRDLLDLFIAKRVYEPVLAGRAGRRAPARRTCYNRVARPNETTGYVLSTLTELAKSLRACARSAWNCGSCVAGPVASSVVLTLRNTTPASAVR